MKAEGCLRRIEASPDNIAGQRFSQQIVQDENYIPTSIVTYKIDFPFSFKKKFESTD
jgi:hypothetical protein